MVLLIYELYSFDYFSQYLLYLDRNNMNHVLLQIDTNLAS